MQRASPTSPALREGLSGHAEIQDTLQPRHPPANDVLLALEEDRLSLGNETLDIVGEGFLDPLWGETIARE